MSVTSTTSSWSTIEGESLSQLLRRRGPLPVGEVLAIAQQVASALAYAHEHEPAIIHRDIKPANIMLEANTQRAVVMDFGIAKELGSSDLTRTNMMVGTLRYSAPEQLRSEALDSRAAIYSFGLVLYELATGQQLGAGLDQQALLEQLVFSPADHALTFPATIPAELRALITKAVRKNPDQRQQRIKRKKETGK